MYEAYEDNEIDFFEFQNSKVCIYNRLEHKAYLLSKKKLVELLTEKLVLMDNNINFNCLSNEKKKYIIEILVKNKYIAEKINISIDKSRKLVFNTNKNSKYNQIINSILYYIILYSSVPLLLLCIYLGFKHGIKFFKLQNLSIICILLNIIPMIIISGLLHEIAHLIVGKKNGTFVPEIGIKIRKNIRFNTIIIPIPIFYTTIIGKRYLNKNSKLKYLLAGISMNIELLSISILISHFSDSSWIPQLQLFGILNYFMAISNILLFTNTDGYYILETVLGVDNLRNKAITFIKSKKNFNQFINKHEKKNYYTYIILLLFTFGIFFLSVYFLLIRLI